MSCSPKLEILFDTVVKGMGEFLFNWKEKGE
jgi:hypothetical protein